MDFLKRHYEKVTLVVLFILFIFLMWLITSLDESTREVDEQDLQLKAEKKDYVSTEEVKNVINDAQNLWKNSVGMNWEISKNQGEGFDLIQAQQFALCPACEAENHDGVKKLIPLSAFGKECPNCKSKLKEPEYSNVRRGRPTPDDLDGDGISNGDEDRFGLNKNFYDDALYDKDGDGFSNVYEIKMKTDPLSANSHPPVWHRLRVRSVDVVPLGFSLQTVDHRDRYRNGKYTDEDKKDWRIAINNKDRRGKIRSRFYQLGDTIYIEKIAYKITDIVLPRDPAMLRPDADSKAKRQTRVTLVNTRGDKNIKDLVMYLGEELTSADKRPVLVDTGIPAADQANEVVYTMKIGAVFSVPEVVSVQNVSGKRGRRSRKASRYQLVKVDDLEKTAVLLDLNAKMQDGKYPQVKITNEGMIPKDMQVITDNGQGTAANGTGE